MSGDPIHTLTAELEQLFMQKDFDGAKYVLQKFFKEQSDEIARLRGANTLLRSQLSAASEAAGRRRHFDDDFVPYADDDYRD